MTAPIEDRGLLLGDGLFETVLFKAGKAVLWERHMARLARGCAVLGLPAPNGDSLALEAAMAVETAGLSDGRAAVRVTWTAGSGGRGLDRPATVQPFAVVSAAPAPAPEAPTSLVTCTVRRNAGSPASRLKTLSYLDNVLARREAQAAGADEALLLNTDGHLACAAAANLFWIAGDCLHTPALACGVLDGIMRGRVLATVPVREVAARPEALEPAQAAFLTNSLIGLRPVASLDGRGLGDHALIDQLRAELADLL
jgi:branched-chain amino acid aminotransferase/4-amino-4-deoxychorismate lyase